MTAVRLPYGTGRRLSAGTVLAVVGAEVRKGLTAQLARPTGHVIAMLTGAGTYLALQYLRGQGSLQPDVLPQTLLAMSVFWFLFYATLVMVTDLLEEKNTGTLAHAHLTPVPPGLLMLGRLATASVGGALMAVVATAVPLLVVRPALPVHPLALVPYALALANALAFAFLMAAFAIATPLIAQIQDLIVKLVFLLGGSLLPITYYPGWLAALARITPTTLGVEATTRMLWRGDSLGDIWADGSLPELLGYTLVFALAAWTIYVHNYRKALRDGRLGQY